MRDVGFYLLVALILVLTMFALRGGLSDQTEVTYGQIRRLLEEQQVSQVSLQDDGTLTLWLKEPVDGQATVRYDVGNPQWFYDDFNDTIVEQQRLGIISDYDYPCPLYTSRCV